MSGYAWPGNRIIVVENISKIFIRLIPIHFDEILSEITNSQFFCFEITYCERKKNPSTFYAKRFAAKEALSKALGTGIRKGINFKNIEVFNNVYGKP